MVPQEEAERFCAAAWPRLVAAMSHYCGDVHVAEELVQEALVRASRRWSRVAGLDSPEGWTYRVAVNLANSRWRRQQAERRALERHGVSSDSHDPVALDSQLLVREALQELTPRQREVVILRFVLDLSADQTADLLGSRPGAVRTMTHRAIERLREALDVMRPVGREVNDVQ